MQTIGNVALPGTATRQVGQPKVDRAIAHTAQRADQAAGLLDRGQNLRGAISGLPAPNLFVVTHDDFDAIVAKLARRTQCAEGVLMKRCGANTNTSHISSARYDEVCLTG